MYLISNPDMYPEHKNIEVVEMKKIVSSAILLLVVTSIFCGIVAAAEVPFGPAPNSGDGVSDGSGLPFGCPNEDSPGDGPAPNSGDGLPDGSGF
jgi:hypothetical protein